LNDPSAKPLLFEGWVVGLVGGLSAGILTTGLIPLIEMVFGYTTNNKLLELANLDYPVLKELTIAAPGTHHHSIIVGSLAETAATAIGANPLLAKVGGYYHDIGKVNKAAYFVENQFSSHNKHDRLAPSMSSLILTTHVRDGVKAAKRYKLGKDITDIIQQHHGTNVITYFYEKAKRLKGKELVNIDNFRYPGPKPQTKEAALVLLADSVEASSRTMQHPTRRHITTLVRNIINTVVLNGQLDECNLTLKDLNDISQSFDKTLNGIYHRRIEYPSDNSAPSMDGLTTTGSDANPNRRQTESSHHRSAGTKEKGDYPAEGFGVS
jgi:putative nucleotidyltransferase with HDIG domain